MNKQQAILFMKIGLARCLLTVRFLIWFPIAFYGLPSTAQVDTSYIKEVNTYIKMVDSLAHAGKLETGISEGTITQTAARIIYNIKQSKNDTTWDSKVIGGFSIEPTFKGDTVFKILYHDNADNNIYETYYFRDKQLVCSMVRLEADGIGTVLYSGAEYYKNGKIVYVKSPNSAAPDRYRARVSFSWRESGIRYYEQFGRGFN